MGITRPNIWHYFPWLKPLYLSFLFCQSPRAEFILLGCPLAEEALVPFNGDRRDRLFSLVTHLMHPYSADHVRLLLPDLFCRLSQVHLTPEFEAPIEVLCIGWFNAKCD